MCFVSIITLMRMTINSISICIINNFLLYLLRINHWNEKTISLFFGSSLIKIHLLTLRTPYVVKSVKDVCRQSVSSFFFLLFMFFFVCFNYLIESSIFIRHVVDEDTIDARTEMIFDGDPDSLCLQWWWMRQNTTRKDEHFSYSFSFFLLFINGSLFQSNI
jgi:hypothetical protein